MGGRSNPTFFEHPLHVLCSFTHVILPVGLSELVMRMILHIRWEKWWREVEICLNYQWQNNCELVGFFKAMTPLSLQALCVFFPNLPATCHLPFCASFHQEALP